MKELILVAGMIISMFLAEIVFRWEATLQTLLWQVFAILFALAYQTESYRTTMTKDYKDKGLPT